MTGVLTGEQIWRFAVLAERVATTSITHCGFDLGGSLQGAAAGEGETTPEAVNGAINVEMHDFYRALLAKHGESSPTLDVLDTLSVVAAVFGALCQHRDLEAEIRAGSAELLVEVLAENWGLVDGSRAQTWIPDRISRRYTPVAEFFWAHVDEDSNGRESADRRQEVPQLRFDAKWAEDGYDCPQCEAWISVEERFCADCGLDTLALPSPYRKAER
jgi:hypothetical protein